MNSLEKINNLDNLQCGEFSRALHEIAMNKTKNMEKILEYAKIPPVEALIEKEEKAKKVVEKDKYVFRIALILSGLLQLYKYFFN